MSSPMQTDIVVVGGGMSSLHAVEECAKDKSVKVTAIFGNNFLEFPMAAAIILADPSEHPQWVCGNPQTFEVEGVTYVYDAVAEVNAKERVITTAKGQTVSYKVLIVASGSKSPLIAPAPGASLADRFAEVKEAAAAIKAAKTVVIYGTGAVGLEVAGDIRARNPEKRVVLVSRDGSILGAESPALRARALPVLKKMKIEVLKGTAGPDFMQPKLTSGIVPLSNGSVSELQYDVWIPAFAQGPNTNFLKDSGALDERGRIAANDCLQSTKFPEIFGCAVTIVPLGGHPISSRVSAQAKTCAKNALLKLQDANPVKHVDKEAPAPMAGPMNIKIGHGKGCATCLGTCGGEPESEGASVFMHKFLLPKFLAPHLYKGAGQLPPDMQKTK